MNMVAKQDSNLRPSDSKFNGSVPGHMIAKGGLIKIVTWFVTQPLFLPPNIIK
jgi:hypothetical protein